MGVEAITFFPSLFCQAGNYFFHTGLEEEAGEVGGCECLALDEIGS